MTRQPPVWTRERIVADLVDLRVTPGDAVLVHASMRAVGAVEGGADTVIEAVMEVVGLAGTVVCPAFNRKNRIEDRVITVEGGSPGSLDFRLDTGTFIDGLCREQVGIFAERLSARPDAELSSHPTLAFSAAGRSASYITANAPFHYSLGTNSPLARLHQLDARIVLIGVDHRVNSAIHLAENWANAPYARRKAAVRMPNHTATELEGNPECSAGFVKIEPLLRQARILRSGYVGNARSQSMRLQHVVSMAMEMLRGNPESLLCDDPSCAACITARRFTAKQDPSG